LLFFLALATYGSWRLPLYNLVVVIECAHLKQHLINFTHQQNSVCVLYFVLNSSSWGRRARAGTRAGCAIGFGLGRAHIDDRELDATVSSSVLIQKTSSTPLFPTSCHHHPSSIRHRRSAHVDRSDHTCCVYRRIWIIQYVL
jgi:hypothetical protein